MTTMAALTRSDSIAGASSTPTTTLKPLPTSSSQAQKTGQIKAPTAPRIDYEPLYAALKAAVGANWHLYGETISLFCRGQLNQAELSRRIDPFLCSDASLTHTHNQFLLAIRTNASRELPEPGVAAFVSANDKPTATSKPVTGDAAEQRLKTEIMQLPARERHRLKAIEGEPIDAFQSMMAEYHDVRQIRPPDLVPASAGGNVKNWELEISKRFQQPLFSESNEFPDAEIIFKRMVPICYQEGLVGGCKSACSDLMTIAAETFLKEQLSDMMRRVRSNGVNYVKTAKHRRLVAKEEEAYEKGEAKKNAYGLLPVEFEVERRRKPFNREDLRFAALMGNSFLAQSRIIHGRVIIAPFVEEEYDDDDEMDVDGVKHGITNGVVTNGVDGFHRVGTDDSAAREADWVWNGTQSEGRGNLDDEFDDVLAIG